jgi:biofilm PGA synthesis lipoprotein PgaB
VPDTIRTLYAWGVQNVAYYPDNLYRNNPDPVLMRPVLDSKPNRAPPMAATRTPSR